MLALSVALAGPCAISSIIEIADDSTQAQAQASVRPPQRSSLATAARWRSSRAVRRSYRRLRRSSARTTRSQLSATFLSPRCAYMLVLYAQRHIRYVGCMIRMLETLFCMPLRAVLGCGARVLRVCEQVRSPRRCVCECRHKRRVGAPRGPEGGGVAQDHRNEPVEYATLTARLTARLTALAV